MLDPTQLALIEAEIDGALDERQRAELSRCLLANPALRKEREDMRRLSRALDAIPQAEPPAQLRADILAALPQMHPRRPGIRSWRGQGWRYAAVLAGVLLTGALVFRVVDFEAPGARDEMSGTLAAPRAVDTLDMVQISGDRVSGRASLIRQGAGLYLLLELAPNGPPVDMVAASAGHTIRADKLPVSGAHEGGTTRIALPGMGNGGEPVSLTFLRDGREIGHAVLKSPPAG
jgi:hypothetical protein